jgi:CheY-like chemotaxis protein
MTAIIVNAELDLDHLPDEPTLREDLQEMRDTAQRAADLAQQLLAFSRRQMTVPRAVDINDVLRATERLLRRLIGAGIELEVTLADDAGVVRVDPAQFEQVLVNLAVNARDAMPSGGRLLIETSRTVVAPHSPGAARGVAPGEYATIAVRDNGRGITGDVLPHVFEPFYTTKAAGGGTGLGLATAYGIIKQAEGHIVAESHAGEGATFTIYLRHLDGVPPEAASVAEPLPAPVGGDETLLLVDDEAPVLRTSARALRALGYTVLEASGGEDALRIAREHRGDIDLLVTDVTMPRMGGPELAGELAASRPAMRVLLMSGYTEDDVVRRQVREQRVAFIQKPFSPGQLAARVRATLDANHG